MYHVTAANKKRITGPATHPICAIAHAKESTPDPMTAVTMCADAVIQFPAMIEVGSIESLLLCMNDFRLVSVVLAAHKQASNQAPKHKTKLRVFWCMVPKPCSTSKSLSMTI